MSLTNLYVELKKSGTKKYILYDSIYMVFKNRYNQYMELEVRMVATLRDDPVSS